MYSRIFGPASAPPKSRCTHTQSTPDGARPSSLSWPVQESVERLGMTLEVTYLLVEDGLGLSSVSRLLAVVPTLSLSEERSLSGLVLRDLVGLVLAAGLSTAEGSSGLGNVNHLRVPTGQFSMSRVQRVVRWSVEGEEGRGGVR